MPKAKAKPADELITRDMYLRYTDKSGAVTVRYHRVWDAERFYAERFYAEQFKAAKKEGGTVEPATAEQYKAGRTK